ncbi:MAG: amidoligase family protein [Rhodocyclaceae bacterium]|nr:amidoligase family protein [Rhodocyclaceae bacterium]
MIHGARLSLPPRPCRKNGEWRHVGFEIEFSGLPIDRAARICAEALGALCAKRTEVDFRLDAPSLGEFRLEVDWAYLKQQAEASSIGEGSAQWVELLKTLSRDIVPLELVCPPIFVDRIGMLLPAVEALRASGARGTGDSLISALGVHVNAELPSTDGGTIERHIRAFGLLQWWLADVQQIDLSRRISPYVDLYPERYVRLLASRRGADTLARLIDDYLEDNPTRNRALDMLPLFMSVDPGRVRAVLEDERIKPRPTFHYRLPDCRIEEPGWSLAAAWDSWLVVERLADDVGLLDRLSVDFVAAERPLFGVSRSSWDAHLDEWLRDHGLA